MMQKLQSKVIMAFGYYVCRY